MKRPARLPDVEGQVEFGDGVLHRQQVDAEPRELKGRQRRDLQSKQHLEQLLPSEIGALQLPDQLAEVQVLMGVARQGHPLHPFENLAKRGIAGDVRAQHENVPEQTDEALNLAPVPIGRRRSDAEVVPARVPRQRHLQDGKRRHKEISPFLLAQVLHRRNDRLRQVEVVVCAPKRRRRGARPSRIGSMTEGAPAICWIQ